MTELAVDQQYPAEGAPAPSRADVFLDRGSALLIALMLAGYPAVALLGTVFSIAGNTESIAFRALVVLLAGLIILIGFTNRRFRMDAALAAFMFLYLGRLVYDWQFANIYQSDFVLTFYLIAVLIPTMALGFAKIGPLFDQHLSRWLMVLGGTAVFGTMIAQRMGLAYNPWAETGGSTPRLMFEALNPIALGYAGATSLVASFIYLTTYRKSRVWTLFAVALLIASGPIILASGSRGPLIATLVAVTWLACSNFRRLAVLAPLVVGLLAFGLSRTYAVQHLIDTIAGGWAMDGSSLGRLDMQRWALEDFVSSPIIGKHFASNHAAGGDHPHNLVIETAMATGLVGLFLTAVVLLRVVNTARSFTVRHPLLTALLIMHAVNAMLSSSLWASEAVFALTCLVLVHRSLSKGPAFSGVPVGR